MTACSVVKTEAESEIEARERVLHQHREDLATLEKLKRVLRNERSRERYREKVGQDTPRTAQPSNLNRRSDH